MNIVHPTAPGGQMTSQQRAESIDALCDAWAEAEAAYEAFLGEYEQIDVLLMPEADFGAWRGNYLLLYGAVWGAQIVYYQALRASHA